MLDKSNRNHSIMCSVDSCKFHCDNADYCALSQIKVGTHEKHPSEKQCTDCQSFVASNR
ncbi:DUF1540 domain-containing protein [Sinanaerobacter chloroacetimidivorans]|jgi:hypothetical protein|uniref:DUF1540 domain-containing protein n=1 Tax=Sinanaerobacter chloroacetimidivorans TaxID=2818044 RepID=A0A8J7W5J3_9FIRM|nr:DUF1540 domain-containing protein [Sinanaerobacter chloroacetimidivorans]MBR0599493.1 DUF1540 domain-containing protein [Sinanaerobacter chloroacetimidivorans]